MHSELNPPNGMNNMFRQKFFRIFGLTTFILRYATARNKKHIIVQNVIGLTAGLLEVLVVILLLGYSKSLGGEGVPYIQRYISGHQSSTMMVSMFIAALLVLSLSVYMHYWSERLLNKIAIDVEKSLSLEFLAGVSGVVKPKYLTLPNALVDQVRTLSTKRAKGASRALSVLLSSSQDIVKVLVFSLICLVISPFISGVIVIFSVFALAWQYSVSRNIHRNQIERDDLQSKIMHELRAWIFDVERSSLMANDVSAYVNNRYIGTNLERWHNAYEEHINATVKSELIGHFFMIIGLVVGLGLVVNGYLDGQFNIPEIIAFFYSARLALSSSKTLFAKIGAYSRLYQHLGECYAFFKGEEVRDYAFDTPGVDGLAVREDVHFTLDNDLALVSNLHLSRITANLYMRTLVGVSYVNKNRLVLQLSSLIPVGETFKGFTGFDEPRGLRAASEMDVLANIGWRAWLDVCKTRQLDPLDSGTFDALKTYENLRFISLLSLAKMVISKTDAVIIDAKILDKYPELVSVMREGGFDRLIVLFYPVGDLPLDIPPEMQVAVVDAAGLYAFGSAKVINDASEKIRNDLSFMRAESIEDVDVDDDLI